MQAARPAGGRPADPATSQAIGADVPGGTLAVELIGAETEPVLAIHGISSQRKLWNWLRAAAPQIGLIAPDLRGRGDSTGLAGPPSICRPAADLVAVLDRLGIGAAHVCGMSMRVPAQARVPTQARATTEARA